MHWKDVLIVEALLSLILIVLIVIAVELHTLQNYVSGTTDGIYTLISTVKGN